MPDRNKKNLKKIKFILGVIAGKGGVGKSTITAHLAQVFQKKGLKVGVLDSDVYGPSISNLLPEDIIPKNNGDQLLPAYCDKIALMSISYFKRGKEASVIRAPIANQIILQFLTEVQWGGLDLLIIDFPPGTGDIQLTLMQNVPFSGALLITTPQDLSLLDVRKSAQMCQQMGVPIIGVIENMSYFIDPLSKEHHHLFGKGGGAALSEEFYIPILAQIPIDPSLQKGERSCSDISFSQASERILKDLKVENISEIKIKDRYSFSINWIDGKTSFYHGSQIQRLCPCVKCIKNQNKPVNLGCKIEIKQIVRVGLFGIQFLFNKGCSQGIYPFSLLRDLDRCRS